LPETVINILPENVSPEIQVSTSTTSNYTTNSSCFNGASFSDDTPEINSDDDEINSDISDDDETNSDDDDDETNDMSVTYSDDDEEAGYYLDLSSGEKTYKESILNA
jgi:hypothetical protein